MSIWEALSVAVLIAALVWLLSKAFLRAYFLEKEAFVDRLVRKIRKGVGDNGKV